jgi:hypothetical protein
MYFAAAVHNSAASENTYVHQQNLITQKKPGICILAWP